MKLICVKKCSYSFSRYAVTIPTVEGYYQFNIGDQYQLSAIQPTYTPDKMCINLTENSNSVMVLKSDFVTLEQWREQQLDKLI